MKVAVVTFEKSFHAMAYIEETGLKWPLLIDRNRELYRAYGMFSAGFLDLWGFKTWWASLKEMRKGTMPKRPTDDISQRGGDVLIDPEGIVRLHHVGSGPADRPEVSTILQRIKM